MRLPDPVTAAGREGLAAVIAEPARAVVAVDFDGTLAPIVLRPEDARAAAGAVEALAALAARVGCCAVVSGRPAADAVRLGGLDAVPRLQVRGHYGLEQWADGRLTSPEPVPGVAVARERLAALVREAPPGVFVEDKLHSLVVHTRPTADPVATLAALTPPLRGLADELGLEAVPGRFVLELRPPGIDKGAAVRELVTERSAAVLLYVGDDLGDLPAFAAVDELRAAGGNGVKVASVDPAAADSPRELAEAADLVLAGPAAVVEFLAALAAHIGET